MKKTIQKLLSLAVLAAAFVLASCDKEKEEGGGDTTPLTKEEAKTKLNSFDAAFAENLQDISESDGLDAIRQLTDLIDEDDPFETAKLSDKKAIKDFFRKNSQNLKRIFVRANGRSAEEGDRFNFAENVGVYEWTDAEGGYFIATEEETTSIIIRFPSSETAEGNDAELEISNYEDQPFSDEFDTWYNPTAIEASLSVGSTVVASVDLSIEWSDDEFPVAADVTLFVAPFTLEASFDDTQATSSSASVSLTQGTENIISASLTATYATGGKTFENMSLIEGHVQLLDIKVQGQVDVAGLREAGEDEEEEVDVTEFLNFALYAGDAKIGDIVFEEGDGEDEETIIMVEYANGDREPLEDILQDASDQIDELFEEFEGEDEGEVAG